jgi:5-methylcytosine-specific restriction endonuclease McrA
VEAYVDQGEFVSMANVERTMLHQAHKTDGGMLPQFRPLEARIADKSRVPARNGCGQTAVVRPSRGETSGFARPGASPAQAENGVSRVFVLARSGVPLMPCHPARARKLLAAGLARVVRVIPFTIRLIDRPAGVVQPVRIKIDPGANKTGMALVREEGRTQSVLHLSEIEHRGEIVRKKLQQRSAYRRRRRSANIRYRAPRFNNRRRPAGWLPPSLKSRADNILSWTNRYMRLCPVSAISVERVRFDTQALRYPEIGGVEYQHGTLAGYEVREYLLEKWGRACIYCGKQGVPLQVEHIQAKGNGGSNRAGNLGLACGECNQKKGKQDVRQFLANQSKRLTHILSRLDKPLSSAAAVNATRNAVFFALRAIGLPVEASTGGRTKWNRSRFSIPKTHALDAVCVGEVDGIIGWRMSVLEIKAKGRGSYQRTRVTRDGFPRGYLMRQKFVQGFKTGDMVLASVKTGTKAGKHVGRVAVRASGSFNIQKRTETVQHVSWRWCKLIQRDAGYALWLNPVLPSLPEGRGLRREGSCVVK